jgi:hypothetical protein
MMRFVAVVAIGLAALLVGGCLGEPDVGPPFAGACVPEDSDPDHDVSFGTDIRPLFDRPRGEGGCSCHATGGAGAPGGFDMSSFAAMRKGGSSSGSKIIVPGDPCQSLLLQKMSAAPPSGARMPIDGPPFLGDEDLQLVSDWIAEGAKDN